MKKQNLVFTIDILYDLIILIDHLKLKFRKEGVLKQIKLPGQVQILKKGKFIMNFIRENIVKIKFFTGSNF